MAEPANADLNSRGEEGRTLRREGREAVIRIRNAACLRIMAESHSESEKMYVARATSP